MAFSHLAPGSTIMEPAKNHIDQILLLLVFLHPAHTVWFSSSLQETIILGKLWPLSMVPKSCQALWIPFPEGKLYILNQGQKHIMLEAFLEESFLCPEIILTGWLRCLLKMLSLLCGVCLLRSRRGCRWVCLVFPSLVKSIPLALGCLAYWRTQVS